MSERASQQQTDRHRHHSRTHTAALRSLIASPFRRLPSCRRPPVAHLLPFRSHWHTVALARSTNTSPSVPYRCLQSCSFWGFSPLPPFCLFFPPTARSFTPVQSVSQTASRHVRGCVDRCSRSEWQRRGRRRRTGAEAALRPPAVPFPSFHSAAATTRLCRPHPLALPTLFHSDRCLPTIVLPSVHPQPLSQFRRRCRCTGWQRAPRPLRLLFSLSLLSFLDRRSCTFVSVSLSFLRLQWTHNQPHGDDNQFSRSAAAGGFSIARA